MYFFIFSKREASQNLTIINWNNQSELAEMTWNDPLEFSLRGFLVPVYYWYNIFRPKQNRIHKNCL